MKTLKQLTLAVSLLILASAASAQTEQTTNNLITNNPQHWTGIGGHSQLGGQHPITLWGCCTSYSGSSPFFDSSTGSPNGQSGQIIWSFGQATVRQVIGINTALSGTGIQISGYNWGYEVRNMNGNNAQSAYSDVLTATTFMTNPVGTRILSDTRTYSGAQEWNWHGGTVNAASPIELANTGQLGVEFSSRDAGFWGGYYGPQVRNVSLSLNYSVQADPCVTNPQSSPSCPGYKTFYNISDDGHAIVPLPFGFPLYGETFTHSIFFSNGAVSFYSPTQPQRWGGGGFGGVNVNNNLPSSYFYTIMTLNTDLINYNGAFYTQGNSNQLKYTWENISQFGRPDSSNTFSLEITSAGSIGLQYSQIDIQGGWSSGIVGNASLGEFITFNAATGSAFSVSETIATDCSNPLTNVNCPGYAQAFFDQQCSLNTLYSPGCPGYAQAFFAQQCSADALYNSQCPGYAEAYALKFIVNTPSTAPVVEESAAVVAVAEEKPVAAVAETAAPAATARPAEPAAPVQLVAAAPAPAAVQPAAAAAPSTRTEPAAAAPARTTRQALAEQRMAAAREAAAKSAQENPGAVAAEVDAAASLEQQAELQNVVLGAMAFVPGFDAYGRVALPDAVGYRPFEIYPGQRNIDTPAARGLIGRSDRIHEEMVNEQYR
jgi:hypothetical protein